MAVKPAPLKASAAPKAVAKIPAKMASPSKVTNTTMKTVNDDAGTVKKAAPTPVVATTSANAPLKAGSAPKAVAKPVQTSNIPASVKPTDLTTKIQQNLNKPQMQPISSNTPMNLYQDRGANAAAELAKAQAASAAQKLAQEKVVAQRTAEKLAQQQAVATNQAAAYFTGKPTVTPTPTPTPGPTTAELVQAQAAAQAKSAADAKAAAQAKADAAAKIAAEAKAVEDAKAAAAAAYYNNTPTAQPIAPVVPTPTPPTSIQGPPAGSSTTQWKQNPTTGAWESYNPQAAAVITPPGGYSLTKPVVNPTPTPAAVISTNPVITPVSGDKPAIPTTVTPVAPQLPNYTPTPVVTPPAMDYSQYKLPTGWGFSKTPAVAPTTVQNTPKV